MPSYQFKQGDTDSLKEQEWVLSNERHPVTTSALTSCMVIVGRGEDDERFEGSDGYTFFVAHIVLVGKDENEGDYTFDAEAATELKRLMDQHCGSTRGTPNWVRNVHTAGISRIWNNERGGYIDTQLNTTIRDHDVGVIISNGKKAKISCYGGEIRIEEV